MALHTHGNQPSRRRALRAVDNVFNVETSTTTQEKIGTEFDLYTFTTRVGKLREGFYMRDKDQSFDSSESRDESYEPIKLLRQQYEDALIYNPSIFIYLGYYDNIADGKMPNEYGEDWITVEGNPRSETYTCPNTITYKQADDDELWFTNGNLNTVTTQELYQFDYTRTLVKYDDDVPNYIRIIGILKPDIIVSEAIRDYIFAFFELSVLWDDLIHPLGHLKNKDLGIRFANNPQGTEPIIPTISSRGALYNWWAANEAGGSGTGSIAPIGWHVPTDAEWGILANALGGYDVAGGKMKETGTTYWETPNTDATNESGFNARGAGYRNGTDGAFDGLGYSSTFFAYNQYSSTQAYEERLANDDGYFWWNQHSVGNKPYGYSIRLLKDDSTDPGTMTDYDGNVYETVKIGNQVWISNNLSVEHLNDGTEIPIVTDGSEWSGINGVGISYAMCYYNNTKE